MAGVGLTMLGRVSSALLASSDSSSSVSDDELLSEPYSLLEGDSASFLRAGGTFFSAYVTCFSLAGFFSNFAIGFSLTGVALSKSTSLFSFLT